MGSEDQRLHFRIHYPTMDRPVLKISGRPFQIANISERGVCLAFRGGFPMGVGDSIRGTIHFKSEKTHRVVGTIIRKVEGKLVFTLDEPIPLPIIMEEQRFLLKKYKTLVMAR
jgi:hypothetical protein